MNELYIDGSRERVRLESGLRFYKISISKELVFAESSAQPPREELPFDPILTR